MLKWAFKILLICALPACSLLGLDDTFRDRSNDYRRSEEMPKIDIPSELDSEVVGELYPIPEGGEVASYQVDTDFEVPRPRAIAISDATEQVKIQRLGESSWILITATPGEAWPRVRSFLTTRGIPTAAADADLGTIETGAVSLTDDESLQHEFLITLSQGVQMNTTEIEILHRQSTTLDSQSVTLSADSIFDSELKKAWPAKSDDPEREVWMRDGLAEALAIEEAGGTASLLGREIGAAAKVMLVSPPQDSPYIDMRLPINRAWASVGYALVKDGFSIADQSFDTNTYIAEYQDPLIEEPGFFDKLGGAKVPEPISYRVILEQDEQRVLVRVYAEDGSVMTQRASYIVLERIRSNLS